MRHVILTGATGAIGSELSRELARRQFGLILMCRDPRKARELLSSMPPGASVSVVTLDLADPDSVRKAAAEIPRIIPATDTLSGIIHNAGIMARSHALTPAGKETDLTVNYLHPRLLTRLILQSGLLGAGAAIVFTTSLTRHMRRFMTPPADISPSRFRRLNAYGVSKRAITLYAAALSRRLAPARIAVNCADPGIVDSGMITMNRWFDPLTDIFFRPLIRRPAQGALPVLRALEEGLQGHTGHIYCRRAVHNLPANAIIQFSQGI